MYTLGTIAPATERYLKKHHATIRPISANDYLEQETKTGHITDSMKNADYIMTYNGEEFFVKGTYKSVSELIRFLKKHR